MYESLVANITVPSQLIGSKTDKVVVLNALRIHNIAFPKSKHYVGKCEDHFESFNLCLIAVSREQQHEAVFKGMLLSKALTCMKSSLYKQKISTLSRRRIPLAILLYEQCIHLAQITLRPKIQFF